jgi:putative acetyltransferase
MPNASLRPYELDDTETILRIHWQAVHQTAAPYYSKDILDEWSPDVSAERIARFIGAQDREKEIILIAEYGGTAAGFGAIVPELEALRAVYVLPDFKRRGIGSALLRGLEELALSKNVRQLQLHSSLNAEPFYLAHGYLNDGPGEHTLRSGRKMPGIKMHKMLPSTPSHL